MLSQVMEVGNGVRNADYNDTVRDSVVGISESCIVYLCNNSFFPKILYDRVFFLELFPIGPSERSKELV